MFKQNNSLPMPIGMLLQNAGLIDNEQLQKALDIQSQYTQMKLGEILVLQAGLKTQTINFFVDKWQKIKKEGQQFPIGYYLKNACLLNDQQIQTILAEQKNNQLKFGDIAVKKGWLKRNTIDFFLDSLSMKPPQLIALNLLEQYNRDNWHLEHKYANPSVILSQVLVWTGGHSELTKTICYVFANCDFKIPKGLEASAVDKFVEKSLIRNWHTTKIGTYIRTVQENFVDNQRCNSISLLQEYREILQLGSKEYEQTKEQEELLILGLIIQEQYRLKVTSLIYQKIFNQSWIAQELKKLQSKTEPAQTAIISQRSLPRETEQALTVGKNTQNNQLNQVDISYNKIETKINTDPDIKKSKPINKIGSLMTLAGIILLIPIVLAINNLAINNNDLLSKQEQEQELASEFFMGSKELKQFCHDLNLADSATASNLISQLENNKQELLKAFPKNLETFPDNCEALLNELRIVAAPYLGKENRVLEAIRHLCKIPANSEIAMEAEIWLARWYNSSSWGKETEFYLKEAVKNNQCPAANFLEDPASGNSQ